MDREEVIGKCLLSELLDKSKMTPAELSVRTGISKQQLNTYINRNTAMSLVTARIISRTLNCKIEDLYIWKI